MTPETQAAIRKDWKFWAPVLAAREWTDYQYYPLGWALPENEKHKIAFRVEQAP